SADQQDDVALTVVAAGAYPVRESECAIAVVPIVDHAVELAGNALRLGELHLAQRLMALQAHQRDAAAGLAAEVARELPLRVAGPRRIALLLVEIVMPLRRAAWMRAILGD